MTTEAHPLALPSAFRFPEGRGEEGPVRARQGVDRPVVREHPSPAAPGAGAS